MKDYFSILVKPTHDCNMNCEYCYDKYFRKKFEGQRMTFETLDKIIKVIANSTKTVNWIWHGGESTLMGIEWFEKAQNLFKKYPQLQVIQGIQTNGINLNEEWVNFFKKHNISVGVSYDFSAQSIRGYEGNIINQLIKASKSGLQTGVITVVNSENYKDLVDIYEFGKMNDLHIAFNMLFNIKDMDESLIIGTNDYMDAFMKLYEHIIKDTSNNSTYDRLLKDICLIVSGKNNINRLCKHEQCFQNFMAVNPIGTIYPCDRYYPENYNLGNIQDFNTLDDVFKSKKTFSFEYNTRISKCRDCDYYFHCKGGCNADHILLNGKVSDVNEDYCNTFKSFFQKTYELLEKLNPYEEYYNTMFWVDVLSAPIILPYEISEFIKNLGYRFIENDYQETSFLESVKYKLFSLFNDYERINPITFHSNYYEPLIEIDVDIDKNFNLSTINDSRQKTLESIYNFQKNKIHALIIKNN